MNLSKFFIDRPIFAGVLSLLMVIAGLIALRALPVSEYPEVVPPQVVVRANYPGANPAVIAETVATPLEEQINGVEDMLYMSSQATTDGLMTLTVTFKLGTDPDKAQQLVQNRVGQAEARLPEEVRRLGVTTVKSTPSLTLVVHLVSPNGRYDLTYLRNYALLNVKDRLARLEGVGDVQMWGSGDYSMRIWLDPQKVAAHGLAAGDVVRAIREQNVQAAAGVVGASPGLPGVDLQLSINAQGRLQSEEAFGDIIVRTGDNGAITRLRDLARIELGASSYALRSTLDNEDAIGIGIFAAPGSNAIEISNSAQALMADLKKFMPDDMEYPIVYDTDQVRPGVDRIGDRDAARGDRARGAGRDPVPADLAGLDHPAAGRPGVGDRHLRGDAAAGLLDQRADPVRAGAGDRDRGRRRHRRGRERRAQHRSRPVAARGHLSRDARGLRTDRRDRAGAGRGVRPARVHQRPDRPVLPPVRA